MKSSVKVTSTGEQVPLNFRYSVTPASKVNSFKPKELPSDCDRRQLRAGQLGAVWCGRLQQLPRADHVGLIWEAWSPTHPFPFTNSVKQYHWYQDVSNAG